MARLLDGEQDAGSNIVQGQGTNALTFVMPGNVALKVESVVAVVDNTAGGDTTALLTIADQSGAVIADKAQGSVIPAGDTGRATFALRLDDETTATPAATSDLLYDYTLTADQHAIDTAVDGPMAGSLSQEYAALDWYVIARVDDASVGTGGVMQILVNDDATASHYAFTDMEWLGVAAGSPAGGPTNNTRWFARVPGALSTAHYFNQIKGSLPAYSDGGTRFRTVQFWAGDIQVTTANTGFLNFAMGVWKNDDPIDRITVRAGGSLINLVAESRLIVVGVGKL